MLVFFKNFYIYVLHLVSNFKMQLFFRVGKQQLRDARLQAVDYLLLLIAGICLGTLAKVSDETLGSTGYTYTVIAVCKFEHWLSSLA